MRKICVVITSRAHYSRIVNLLHALKNRKDIELQIVVGASAVLNKYGNIVSDLEKEGFNITAKITMMVEGGSPITMAKTTGLGLLEFATVFENLNPDIVVVRGDRFETLAPAIASTYMNKILAHIEGGDRSGTIDESVRHAISKLAHIHFPTNEESAERLRKMGEHLDYIFNFGSLDIEYLSKLNLDFPQDIFEKYVGVGDLGKLEKPYLVVLQHPVTTEHTLGYDQITETLQAINELKLPTIWVWPNADAGTEQVSKGIRVFRENNNLPHVRFLRNLHPADFSKLLNHAACVVGNSSAAIKECSFLGTPAVNIGTRQNSRLTGGNVTSVGYNREEIKNAIEKQMQVGKYPSNTVYFKPNTSEKIAEVLATINPDIQKLIQY